MSICIPGKLIILTHARCATQSIHKAITGSSEINHKSYDELDQKLGNEKIYCTIRNPYDLYATWWALNPSWHHHGIENFIKNYRHNYFKRESNDPEYLYDLFYLYWDILNRSQVGIIRYETLQRDMDYLGIDKLPYIGRTKNKVPYNELFDKKCKELIYNIHKHEFKEFDYKVLL